MDDLIYKDSEDIPLPGENVNGNDDAGADTPKDETTLKRSAPDTDADDASDSADARRKRPATEGDDEDTKEVLHFLVPSKLAGSVIGKGGATIKAMRERSGAVVRVNAQYDATDRSVECSGTLAQIEHVFKLIMTKLHEAENTQAGEQRSSDLSDPMDDDTEVECRVLVPNAKMGGLIGKQGVTVNALREETECRILIPSNDMGGGMPDRAVTVAGNLGNVVMCVRRIVEKLRDIKPSFRAGPGGPASPGFGASSYGGGGHRGGMPPMGVGAPAYGGGGGGGRGPPMGGGGGMGGLSTMRGGPGGPGGPPGGYNSGGRGGPGGPPGGYQSYGGPPGGGGGGRGGYGGGGAQPVQHLGAGGGSMESESVSVPDEYMGKIIGKKGVTINDVRRQSGCKVDIHNADEANPTIRIITLTGGSEQRSAAKYLISSYMY